MKTDNTIAAKVHVVGSTYAAQSSEPLTRCWADLYSGRCYYRNIP